MIGGNLAEQKSLATGIPVIFVWRAVLHSRLRPYLQGVIDTIGTLFGDETVLAMWHRTTEISDSELASLGFRRIAGRDLIYRH